MKNHLLGDGFACFFLRISGSKGILTLVLHFCSFALLTLVFSKKCKAEGWLQVGRMGRRWNKVLNYSFIIIYYINIIYNNKISA